MPQCHDRFDCIKLIWGDAWNDLVDNDHDGKLIEVKRVACFSGLLGRSLVILVVVVSSFLCCC